VGSGGWALFAAHMSQLFPSLFQLRASSNRVLGAAPGESIASSGSRASLTATLEPSSTIRSNDDQGSKHVSLGGYGVIFEPWGCVMSSYTESAPVTHEYSARVRLAQRVASGWSSTFNTQHIENHKPWGTTSEPSRMLVNSWAPGLVGQPPRSIRHSTSIPSSPGASGSRSWNPIR